MTPYLGWFFICGLLAFQCVQPGVDAIQTLEDGPEHLNIRSAVIESRFGNIAHVPWMITVLDCLSFVGNEFFNRGLRRRDLLGLLELGDAGV